MDFIIFRLEQVISQRMRLLTYTTCSYLLKKTQWEKSQEVNADDSDEVLHSICLNSLQVSKAIIGLVKL